MSTEDIVEDIVKQAMFNSTPEAIVVDDEVTGQKKVAQVTITNRFISIVINDPQAENLGELLDEHGWELGSFTVNRQGELTFSIWEQSR